MFERFRNSSGKVQTAAVLLIALIFSVVLTMIWYFTVRVAYQPIFTHLAASDAAAIVGELDKRKIPYRLSDSGRTIAVPEDQADTVRLSFAGNDLAFKSEAGFELFDKSDIGITDFAQKINFQRALQGELERTIVALDGVESARVHLSMGDDRLFRQDRAPPKASVTLRMRDAAQISAGTVAGVQQLVSAAVPLLDPPAVVVLDEAGNVLSGASPSPTLPPQAAEKRAVEEYFEARVRAALDSVFGPGYVLVTVTADAATSGATQAVGNPQFDLKNRTFRLQVSLRPRNPLTGKPLESARMLASQAVGLNAALGDMVVFEEQQIPSAAGLQSIGTPLQTAHSTSTKDVSDKFDPAVSYVAAGGIGFLAICLGLLFMTLRRPGTASLDESGRLTFAERLKSLLDEEANNDAAQA